MRVDKLNFQRLLFLKDNYIHDLPIREFISRDISSIYREGEVSRESTCAKYALVQNEGNRQVERQVECCNLDVST